MKSVLLHLVQSYVQTLATRVPIIPWSSPVPVFGDVERAQVASVGINPSNREFVDESGLELRGSLRRFPTLSSLGLSSWDAIEEVHVAKMYDACCDYFLHNPYDLWFRRLDDIIAGTQASYYDRFFPACHLDLVPFATAIKWTDLSNQERSHLLGSGGGSVGLLLKESQIEVLILNGRSVVAQVEQLAGVTFKKKHMPEWDLPRNSGVPVPGYAYQGVINTLGGVPLGRSIQVLGFNHNIQSSFGVTKAATEAIRKWVESRYRYRIKSRECKRSRVA